MSALAAWYPFIKQWHIALVALSGALFAARGVGTVVGAHWPMRWAPRIASVAIDTLLLTAGGTLWVLLQLNPLRERWLGAKLLLLVAYVVLGTWTLKRAHTPVTRALFLFAALAVFATMIGIALAHDAAGFWRFLLPS